MHVIIDINDYLLHIINVYAPNDGNERFNFYTQIKRYLFDIRDNDLLMIGDFNCTLNPSIDRVSKVEGHKRSSNILRDIVKEYHLIDSYRYLYPDFCDYTWFNVRAFSRIDRIYISGCMKTQIIQCFSTPCPYSDHRSVKLVLCRASYTPRKSYWKLNVKILEEIEYVQLISNFWRHWQIEKDHFTKLQDWWDLGKVKVKQLTQQYCSARANNIAVLEEKLKLEICELQQRLVTNILKSFLQKES